MEKKEVIQEGANINKSLLALTNCINILSSYKNTKSSSSIPYIPYRNSKLTRLLKDSLGGRTPVVMIVCLSPNSIYLEESLNSIKYAQKAKNIKIIYKRDLLSTTNYLGVFSNFGNSDTYRDNLLSDRNWMLREAYEKRIYDLERECRYWRTLRERNMTERSHNVEKLRISEENLENALSDLPLNNIEEEFSELVQALAENIEDENLLKQNVLELDELIRQNDEDINEVQRHIDECKTPEIVSELYEELRFLADRLEENLDLKEEAMKEAEFLKRTIECTKLALKKMFSQKIKQVKTKSSSRKPKNSNISELKKKVKELGKRNDELTSALGNLVGEENMEEFLRTRTIVNKNFKRRALEEISNRDFENYPAKLKNAGVGEVLNVLMYKFKPKKKKEKRLVSPLDLAKEIKSEGKTLIYSDSAREDFFTNRNIQIKNSKRSGLKNEDTDLKKKDQKLANFGGLGNFILSGRCTEETNTNPMSLISSSSGRYISNEDSKKSDE